MSDFEPLTWAFEEWFERPLCELPDALRQRMESELSHMPWDTLTADQRRSLMLQMDYQHDPATEQDQQFWWDFFVRMDDLKKQIATWEAAATPTANDLALREARLAELRQELATMKRQEMQSRSDYYPARKSLDNSGEGAFTSLDSTVLYVAYPKAMRLLADRLEATQEELAAWVWMGPKDGGLAAFLNADELDQPPRFYYNFGGCNDFDYLSPLMACWFREDDIDRFEPADRYIAGRALIERWGRQPAIQPEALIRAKIAESRLNDIHPLCGGTQGTFPEDNTLPLLTDGLFALAEVEKIEAQDFALDDDSAKDQGSPCRSVKAWQIRQYFLVIRNEDENEKWWKEKMADAERYGLLDCRIGQGKKGPGGSLWRPELIAAWLVDRNAKGREGLSSGAARVALKKFPGFEELAEELFPSDE